MTEQPAETMTEQQFLGNPVAGEVRADILAALPQRWPAGLRPVDPDELHVRAAQRIAPAPLTPPVGHWPVPVVAMSRPYEVAHANVLLRKTITAAAKLQQARQASEKAEEALQAALAAESLAEIDSTNADRELLDFTREAADQ